VSALRRWWQALARALEGRPADYDVVASCWLRGRRYELRRVVRPHGAAPVPRPGLYYWWAVGREASVGPAFVDETEATVSFGDWEEAR